LIFRKGWPGSKKRSVPIRDDTFTKRIQSQVGPRDSGFWLTNILRWHRYFLRQLNSLPIASSKERRKNVPKLV